MREIVLEDCERNNILRILYNRSRGAWFPDSVRLKGRLAFVGAGLAIAIGVSTGYGVFGVMLAAIPGIWAVSKLRYVDGNTDYLMCAGIEPSDLARLKAKLRPETLKQLVAIGDSHPDGIIYYGDLRVLLDNDKVPEMEGQAMREEFKRRQDVALHSGV